MKNIKVIAICIAGLSVTAFATYAAEPGVSIFANINSFTQYIQNIFVTSDGTPNGIVRLSIDGDGNFNQKRIKDNVEYMFLNTDEINDNPIVGAIAIFEDMSYLNGIQSLPGNGLMSVVGAVNNTLGYVNFLAANENGIAMSHVTQMGESDSDNEILVNGNGVQFSFVGDGNYYRFPMTKGLPGQALVTDGNGELYWADMSEGEGGGAGVSSLNGQIGDLWLTTDDIEQGEENQFLVTKRITLSAEQILNLHTNPIQALPAPGSNKIITILDIFARLNAGTPYTPSGFPNIAVYYEGQNPMEALKTNYDFLQNTTEFVQKLSPGCFGNCASDMNNKGLYIGYEAGASVSGGDGTVDLYISYKILDLNMPVE